MTSLSASSSPLGFAAGAEGKLSNIPEELPCDRIDDTDADGACAAALGGGAVVDEAGTLEAEV